MRQLGAALRQESHALLWFPLYLLCFLLIEHIPFSHYWVAELPLDRLIPFCEWFMIPYTLWYPLLIGMGVYLLLHDRPAFHRYMNFMSLSFFLSLVIFILLPSQQDLRPLVMPRQNLLTEMAAFLYRIDSNQNVFPSVHVVGSIGAALAAWDSVSLRSRPGVRWAVTALAALICISTLFVKQHTCLDVVGGVGLCLLLGSLPGEQFYPIHHHILRPQE